MNRVLLGLLLLIGLTLRVHPQQRPYIRLNQLGVPSAGAKTAVIFSTDPLPAGFRVVNADLATFYREGIERTVKQGETNPYGIGVPFIWCSNNLTVALATQALLYERMTGDRRYREFTSKQIDWLLGRNPWGVSMFTGIPAKGIYPRDVHLFPNVLMKRMVPGGLVDGPVYRKVFQSLRGVSIKEPDPLAMFQDERAVYHDDVNDYSTNEPTMDGTASAILLFALLG